MKVLYIATSIDKGVAATLLGLHEQGVELDVVAEPGLTHLPALASHGIPTTELAMRWKYDWRAIRYIRRRLLDGGYDILHLQSRQAIRNALPAARGLDVKIVVYRGQRGLYFHDPTTWMTYLHPRVDRIICVSEAIRREILGRRWFGFGISPDRLVTIYKGHDLGWYSEAPVDLGAEGIPPGAFTVGFTANLRPGKRIDDLIASAEFLPADAPVHFVLVGRGTDAPAVAKKIAQTPQPATFHTFGARRTAGRMMAACDVVVNPSVREGLSRVVIEAMAHGRPVVVTPSSGGEIVEEGVSGIIVPERAPRAIAAAILRLMNDPEEARSIGAAARERIRRDFPVEETIRATRRLYQDLLDERQTDQERP